jgi:short-subunit dehydrogenase
MMTNADVSERLKNQNWLGRKSILAVDDIARIGLEGLNKNNPLIIPGWSNRLNQLLFRWLPWSFRSKALVRFMKRELGLG